MSSSSVAPIRGRSFLVVGYHTGNFLGRCESIGRTMAQFTVLDPMRPLPRISDRCPFPGCVRDDFHGGDHELATVRLGATIEIFWQHARYVPAESAASFAEQDTLDPWNAPCSIRG